MWPSFKCVTCTEYSQQKSSDFSSKISFFFFLNFCSRGCVVSSSRVCLPTRVRRESVSKRHKRADGGVLFFRKIFRARDTTIHSLNADLSLEHTTKLRERECYFIRARLLFLSVLFYTNAAPQV